MDELTFHLLGLQTALYPALHGEEYGPEDRVIYFIMLGISALVAISWLLYHRLRRGD
jgi:hypothetical protein